MTVSNAFLVVSLSAVMASMNMAATANAGSMFTVTDLGNSYTLQQDASGMVHSVTSGDGSRTYAFQKSQVTQINENPDNPNDFGS